jgi:hypothetical protein
MRSSVPASAKLATTTRCAKQLGFTEPAKIRVKALISSKAKREFLAHVEEGLGTKNLVADEMKKLTGEKFLPQRWDRHRRDDCERSDHHWRVADLGRDALGSG